MSATIDLESSRSARGSLEPRRLVRYAVGSFAVPFLLIGYCQLCSLLLGLPAPGLSHSAPWALQIWLPWLVIGAAFGTFGQSILEHRMTRTYPRALIATVVFGVAAFAVTFEALLAELRGTETSLTSFAFQRAPVHTAVSALLLVMYLGHRFLRVPQAVRSPAESAVDVNDRPEPTVQVIQLPPARDDLGRARPVDHPRDDMMIEVMTGTGRTHIPVTEIECLQADGNYINVIHVSGRTYLLRQTMAAAERLLDGARFMRIHRSTIVNRQLIKERRTSGTLVLQSGRIVTVSRAYRSHVRH